MLRFIYAKDLERFPLLTAEMFSDRAKQFRDRLKWEVQVDDRGFEQDAYDKLGPLYVIWQDSTGGHGGSLRLLPTTGPTMINDHFAHLAVEGPVVDPAIWECTRFCLAPSANGRVAAALMLGGGAVLRSFGLDAFVGVFDRSMVRVYRGIGASPRIFGAEGPAYQDGIGAGMWHMTPTSEARVAQRAGISPRLVRHWLLRSLGNVGRPSGPSDRRALGSRHDPSGSYIFR